MTSIAIPATSRPRATQSSRWPASCSAAAASATSPAAQIGAGLAPPAAASGRTYARIICRSIGSTIKPPKTTSGMTAKKTQCQLNCWVIHAETGGPTKDGSTQAVEM